MRASVESCEIVQPSAVRDSDRKRARRRFIARVSSTLDAAASTLRFGIGCTVPIRQAA
jgi:hypothetical protein